VLWGSLYDQTKAMINLFDLGAGLSSSNMLTDRPRRDGTQISSTLCFYCNCWMQCSSRLDLYLSSLTVINNKMFLVRVGLDDTGVTWTMVPLHDVCHFPSRRWQALLIFLFSFALLILIELECSLAPFLNLARTNLKIEIDVPFAFIFQALHLVEAGKMSRELLILLKFMQRIN